MENAFSNFITNPTKENLELLDKDDIMLLDVITQVQLQNKNVISIMGEDGKHHIINPSVAEKISSTINNPEKIDKNKGLINANTKMNNSLKADVYHIFTDEKYYRNSEHECLNEKLRDAIKAELVDEELSFGDFIVDGAWPMSGYRNEGIYMWDGDDVIHLDWDIDEYGSLPYDFEVWKRHPEDGFIIPLRYWDFIEHNNFVRFDHRPYVKDMVIRYDNILLDGLYTLNATWDNVHFIVFSPSEKGYEHKENMVKPLDDNVLELRKNKFADMLNEDELIFEYEPDQTEHGGPVINYNIIYLPILKLANS
jgi:hypothetical protein